MDIKDKLIKLCLLSIPMIGNAILSQMIDLITMLYVGRINGALYMGAATLGNMLLVFISSSFSLFFFISFVCLYVFIYLY